jgi:hypothetical protein
MRGMFCRLGKHCRAGTGVTQRKPWRFRANRRFGRGMALANTVTTTKDSQGVRLCH